MHKLLESLTSAYAVSGDEQRLHDIIRGATAGRGHGDHETPLGNLLAVRRGQSSDHSILFAAHLDEVGAWVTRINDKGFLGIHCRSVDPASGRASRLSSTARVPCRASSGSSQCM